MRTQKGWLFDLYPSRDGMVLWLKTEQECLRLVDTYWASFYLAGPDAALKACVSYMLRQRLPITTEWTERRELLSNRFIPVLKVSTSRLDRFSAFVQLAYRFNPELTFYNCDILLPQRYLYETGLFPLAQCELTYDESLRLKEIQLLDSPWAVNYPIPPLRFLQLRMEHEANPSHARTTRLIASVDDREFVFEAEGAELLRSLNSLLQKYDPDVILSRYGDSYILPRLRRMADTCGIPLDFNRDGAAGMTSKQARSFFTYGRIVYQAGAQILHGRWHLDIANSFVVKETGLDGLMELARVTKLPVQRCARTSPGTGVSSMQLDVAFQDGYLIPWRKRMPEDFKTGSELLLTDKGGLVFQPQIGLYEQVCELDFSSMFPSIMVKYNISQETLRCACCPENRVPEIGHHICTKRRGLVPRTLEPVLTRRRAYKLLMRQAVTADERELYNKRQSALKWLGLVSFGYQGYRNARFGRLEGHEAVTAYARETLLAAKEIAEAQGYSLIHAIVDSMWLKKAGATREDYERLAADISRQTGLSMAIEGVYHWIAFLPSRVSPKAPVPNRYFGCFVDGTLKVRGLEVRRSDTPGFVRSAQAAMLKTLSQARTYDECTARVPELLDELRVRVDALRSGGVPLAELAISRHLSLVPVAYKTDTILSEAAKDLASRGVHLSAGETIQLVIVDSKANDHVSKAKAYGFYDGSLGYDVEKYTELTLKAAESVLWFLGYDYARLKALISGERNDC
ncbi:DNA polymerase domain-containing protein [Candidatus Methylomirabilis limnetica]|nr:DNA polymerase domain-containing protein [Candidatus Methylomirabilis limnetica]